MGEPGAPGGPPAGVKVRFAGLPVIAAAAASDLSSSRYWLTLAGLLAVALVLLAAYRSFRRALVPLIPVLLATGWSALVLWLSQIPLNPMSAALGALTIAIATEFSVILAARFREERGGGLGVPEAIRAAYARTGAAVLASAVTVIAGFAVLIASDVPMLRDFGFVTVIDLAVALLGRDDRAAGRARLAGGVVRDRYSLVVGLIFAAIIVIAVAQHAREQGRRDARARQGGRALAAARVRRARRRRAARRRRQRRPGRLRNLAGALPGRAPAAFPPAGSAPRGDPGLRLLRPPVRDLVLVLARRQTAPNSRTWSSQVYARYRGRVSFLSLDVRDDRDTVRELIRRRGWRMPVGYDRDGAVGAPLPGRRSVPTFAYVYPGGTLQSASIGELTAAQLEAPCRAAAAGDPGRGGELRWSAEAAGPELDWEPLPEQGWVAPHIAAEFPGLGLAWVEVDGRPGARARSRCGGACATSPTASTARTRSTCASGRSPGPTASSSARSASTPTAPAPRSSSSPSTASTTAPSSAAACPPTR